MAKRPRLPIKVDDLGLSVKEIRFVAEYCTNNFDAPAAMKAAKLVSDSVPTTELKLRAMELLNRQNILSAVNRFISSELDPYRDKLSYQILTSMQARAFYDPSTFFLPDGTARELDVIPQNMRQAIDSVEVKHYGKDGNVLETVYKLADKPQAIKSLLELLNRKVANEDESMNTSTRARLDEIFKMGVAMGEVASDIKSKRALPAESDAIPARDFLRSIKNAVTVKVVEDAEEK